ncbi:hypothetical protein DVH24_042190 [Malus domestica]|uniref:Uncharacterized protein n=1 Tax=Malus domestica TaxID=3750 RepID=A0A498IXG0_MALDO|nr:hypothetical protein DVH24_042190 [Malus domestica]
MYECCFNKVELFTDDQPLPIDFASSPRKPQYALIGMLLAFASLLTCIWELLAASLTVQYVCFIRHEQNPIKVSLWPAIFLVCLAASRLSWNRMQQKSDY